MNIRIHKNKGLAKWMLIILVLFSGNQLIASPAPRDEFFITYPDKFPTAITTDLVQLLKKYTGKNWTTVKNQSITCGFALSILEKDDYKTGESCRIISNGNGLVSFYAPTINGLIFGVYRYLRDLGFKFYLPDELYTVIPTFTTLFKKENKMVTPLLRIRTFFGTGGFGSGKTDADRSVQNDWQLWMWQNGFGSEFQLAGHVGETFNLNNADMLEKNPDWTAAPIKTNGKVNVATKLNYFNPAAVDFFTDWVIRKYKDKNYNPPPAYIRDMVSIDPADGGGFKTGTATVNNVKLKTISDQVFNAANVAAKKLDKLFPNHPNIGVNLYAYSNHADVPDFTLHPRVFVQLIPYQFQNIAFGPSFIKRWSEKVNRFGLYDYFKYPDSHHDLPGGYTLDLLMTRALHAGNAGSEGTTYESSYSKFATAIPLWVLIRYMADGDTQWKEQYSQLIKDLYGKASPFIEKLFQQFYLQTNFGMNEMKAAYQYLEEADRVNSSPIIAKRLEELKLYLTYVELYQASQNTQTGTMEERLLPVFKMAWTLYEKKIVHSYREMQLVSYIFLNTPGPDAATTSKYKRIHILTFPETDDKEAYWKEPDNKAKYSEEAIRKMYENNKKKAVTTITTDGSAMLATVDVLTQSKKQFKAVTNFEVQGNSTVRGYFTFYAEKPSSLEIAYTLTGDTPELAATISGTDNDYKNVFDKVLTGKSGTYSINIPAGETFLFVNAAPKTTYRFKIKLKDTWVYFNPSPRGKMAFINKDGGFSYQPKDYPTYFFVPKGVTEISYKVQVNQLKLYAPDGKQITTTTLHETQHGGVEIRSFKVEPQYQGKFWQGIVGGNFNYELLNIPNVWYMLEPK